MTEMQYSSLSISSIHNLMRYAYLQHIRLRDASINTYNILFPVSGSKIEYGATVWRMPTGNDVGYSGSPVRRNSQSQTSGSTAGSYLQELCKLPNHQGQVKCVLWHPGGDPQTVSLDDQHIRLWDIDVAGESATVKSQSELETRGLHTFYSGKWNPHQSCNQVATAVDMSVKGWDLRNMQYVSVCLSVSDVCLTVCFLEYVGLLIMPTRNKYETWISTLTSSITLSHVEMTAALNSGISVTQRNHCKHGKTTPTGQYNLLPTQCDPYDKG